MVHSVVLKRVAGGTDLLLLPLETGHIRVAQRMHKVLLDGLLGLTATHWEELDGADLCMLRPNDILVLD